MSHQIIKANTYPLSKNSEEIVNKVKENFLLNGSSYLDCVDHETIKELNKLSHPDILLFNIVRNEYIFKRFVTVLIYNFGYNHGENLNENLENPENKKVMDFISDIIKVSNISCVPESTKQMYLRTAFVKRNLTKQKINHLLRANFEFDILKTIKLEHGSTMYDWLYKKTIMDVGCGPGHFLGELEINNVTDNTKLHGIDVASYVNEKYVGKFNQHFYFLNSQFPALPKLDFISFFMSLHHIELYKMHVILLQLFQMLNNDGYIYVKEHLVECQDDVIFFKFMETYFYFVEDYIPNVPVEDNYYTKDCLIEVFQLYGFEIVTYFEINKNQPFKPFYYLFKKSLTYDNNSMSEDKKMNKLTLLIAKMKTSNMFSNGNLYKKSELRNFTFNDQTEDTFILKTEIEKTELQLERGKFELK